MLAKKASPNNWQKILSALKKIKNIPQKTLGYINNPSMIEFEQSAKDPRAVAYVTNEDYNHDGKTDSLKVHIVVPTFNSAFRTSDLASLSEDHPEFKDAIERIAKTLVHEVEGHVNDFNPNNPENPFAGDEAVAESAEKAFTPVWASTTTNNKVTNGLELQSKGDYKVKTELVKLANHLDSIGHSDLADRLDSIVKNAEQVSLEGQPTANEPVGSEGQLTAQDLEDDANREVEEVDEGVADDAQAAANTLVAKSSDTQDRINKIASMISAEFSLSGKSVNR